MTEPTDDTPAAPTKAETRSRRRRWVIATGLTVIAVLGVVASGAAIWADRTLLDTDRFVGLVGPLIDDPEVTVAVEGRLTDSVVEALDVENRVATALAEFPRAASLLGPPIAEATAGLVSDAVTTVLESDAFRSLWFGTLEVGHSRALALLEGDYASVPNITVGEEEVTLNLIPLVIGVIRQLTGREGGLLDIDAELPEVDPAGDPRPMVQLLRDRLGVELPEDFGQVTVMATADLEDAQNTFRRLQRLAPTLVIITLLAIIGAIWVAPDRRKMAIWLGVGVVAAILVARAVINALREGLLDRIADPEAQGAADSIFAAILSDGWLIGTVLLVLGALIALVAYLAGTPAWLERASASFTAATAETDGGTDLQRWVAGHRGVLIGGAVVVAALLIALFGIGWLEVIIVGAALGLFIWEVNILAARGEPSLSDEHPVEV